MQFVYSVNSAPEVEVFDMLFRDTVSYSLVKMGRNTEQGYKVA